MAEPADDLRADFEAAYEKFESEEKPEPSDVPRETSEPEAPIPEEQEKPEPVNDEKQQPESEPPKPEEKPTPIKNDKAPASWTPKAREIWKNVPEEARAQIAKRESEINQTLQQSAQARQGMQYLNKILEPYRAGLQASGVNDPFQAIQALFQTESSLRSGNSHQKALTIANLIKNYGVDIATLDSLLVGETPKANPTADLEAIIDKRLSPINQFLQQQQMTQQQWEREQQNQATQSVAEFSQNAEFIEDVRNDMADLLDIAAKHGHKMTLQQAYDKACALNPEVSKVLEQRAKQQQLMGTQNQMQAKRAAAASLTGSKGGEGAKGADLGLRETIEEAWNSLEG